MCVAIRRLGVQSVLSYLLGLSSEFKDVCQSDFVCVSVIEPVCCLYTAHIFGLV